MMPRPRRGPPLCDDCKRPALIPWVWRGRVVCPGCLLRALSDAIRSAEPIAADPYDAVLRRQRDQRRTVTVAEAQGQVARINGRKL